MKKILFILAALAFLVLAFSHPAIVAEGCKEGLALWYASILPSLLPFLIFSGLLIQTGLFHYLNRIYAPILSRIFRISEEGCYAILIGFLCGFPMGAKTAADLVREGHISPGEGSYLLGFCNNVSPAFFLNYVCGASLGLGGPPARLFLLFYSIPILYGLITRPFFHFTPENAKNRVPRAELLDAPTAMPSLHRLDFPMLDTCIMDGFSTITRLGGYIMLFTILVKLLGLLPLSSPALAVLSALLEVSCGVDRIASFPGLGLVLRAALVCTCAALGGLCICAQTSSVLEGTPLSVWTWIQGRIVTALLTFPLVLLLPVFPARA